MIFMVFEKNTVLEVVLRKNVACPDPSDQIRDIRGFPTENALEMLVLPFNYLFTVLFAIIDRISI